MSPCRIRCSARPAATTCGCTGRSRRPGLSAIALQSRSRVARLRALLAHRYLILSITIAAMILTLPSLRVGLLFDDYHHKLLFSDSRSPLRLLRSPLDLFRFFDGDREKFQELLNYGAIPWWSYPGVRGAFWRPLASATHWLDYALWPTHPALMHLQ